MKATLPFIEQRFREFNQRFFGGKLPMLPIELSNAKSYLGLCAFKKNTSWLGKTKKYDFRLRISTRVNLTETELEDVIIHEMIHYYIGVNNLRDRSAHGPLFRQMMNEINDKFDRHVTVSAKLTKEQREESVDRRVRWHVIAVVSFKDGRCGIRVLPQLHHRILFFYRRVIVQEQVEDLNFYQSNDIFWNRYPCSSALRLYIMGEQEIGMHLNDAIKIKVTG